MAHLLIKANDPHPSLSSEMALIGAQKWDIIIVRNDNWQWGLKECLPDFIIVRVPDKTQAELIHLERSYMSGQIYLAKRKYGYDFIQNKGIAVYDQIEASQWMVVDINISDILDKAV